MVRRFNHLQSSAAGCLTEELFPVRRRSGVVELYFDGKPWFSVFCDQKIDLMLFFVSEVVELK